VSLVKRACSIDLGMSQFKATRVDLRIPSRVESILLSTHLNYQFCWPQLILFQVDLKTTYTVFTSIAFFSNNIQVVTGVEVDIGNCFPDV